MSFKFPSCSCQVSKWILNSQENNGILVVTTLPSGNWMESLIDTNTYLVIFSDDGGMESQSQQYLGKATYIFPSKMEGNIFVSSLGQAKISLFVLF